MIKQMISRKLLPCFLFLNLILFLFSSPLFAEDDDSLEYLLKQKLETIQKELTQDPQFIALLRQYHQAKEKKPLKEIKQLDQTWQKSEGVTPAIIEIIDNPIAEMLKDFQKHNRSLIEIFITDEQGLLIASTNKTSDYYQADEVWWHTIFSERSISGIHGKIEYDDSIMSDAIPIYFYINDPQTHTFLGILKCLSNIDKLEEYNRQ